MLADKGDGQCSICKGMDLRFCIASPDYTSDGDGQCSICREVLKQSLKANDIAWGRQVICCMGQAGNLALEGQQSRQRESHH